MRMRLLTAVAAGLLLAAEAPKPPAPGAALDRALHRTAAATGYTFTTRDGPAKAPTVEGTYEKGKPVALRAERIDFYRKGKVLVYQDAGRWQKTRTGTVSDPLRILGASAKVRAAGLPHEELAVLEKGVEGVKKAAKKEGGATVYSGTLTAEAVKKLTPAAYRDVARGGRARVWVNADGAVVKYAITLVLKGRLGSAEVDGERDKTVTVADVGSARVKVPEGATKALE